MNGISHDELLDFIEAHRAAYISLSQAEAAFDTPDADEGGTVQGLMLTASKIERRLYDALLTTQPNTIEGVTALIRYVDEVARQQGEKGHHDRGPEILAANLEETSGCGVSRYPTTPRNAPAPG